MGTTATVHVQQFLRGRGDISEPQLRLGVALSAQCVQEAFVPAEVFDPTTPKYTKAGAAIHDCEVGRASFSSSC